MCDRLDDLVVGEEVQAGEVDEQNQRAGARTRFDVG